MHRGERCRLFFDDDGAAHRPAGVFRDAPEAIDDVVRFILEPPAHDEARG